jgi:hypothetical protein
MRGIHRARNPPAICNLSSPWPARPRARVSGLPKPHCQSSTSDSTEKYGATRPRQCTHSPPRNRANGVYCGTTGPTPNGRRRATKMTAAIPAGGAKMHPHHVCRPRCQKPRWDGCLVDAAGVTTSNDYRDAVAPTSDGDMPYVSGAQHRISSRSKVVQSSGQWSRGGDEALENMTLLLSVVVSGWQPRGFLTSRRRCPATP